ncbi:hypothetical protein [Methanococcus maripaludis]|uniref:Uncharacterized protein n=1 Tax=Methanococcus maripaludis TaxID=39152 RepID=A0A7J9PE14_METMI|nr:hypothetical protein [Methanococcus maripaludis]MBA2861028.1 hypothetical protein [Methanococcus maripaludis]
MEFKNQFNKFLLFGILGTGVLIKYFLHPEYGLNIVYISLFVFLISLSYILRYFIRIPNFSNEDEIEYFSTKIARTYIVNPIILMGSILRFILKITLKPSKIIVNVLSNFSENKKYDEFLVYLVATLLTSLLIIIISAIIAVLNYHELFGIFDYFKRSDLLYSFLSNVLVTPTLKNVITVLAVLLGYFSLIEHIKSNKLYFKELKDTKLKSYLDFIFGIHDLFSYVYPILGIYLILNNYILEFFVLLFVYISTKGVFSTVFLKYREYLLDYNKLDAQNNSELILSRGKKYFLKLGQKLDEKYDEFSKFVESDLILIREWNDKKLDEDKIFLDISRVKNGKMPEYKITQCFIDKLCEIDEPFPNISDREINKNDVFNWLKSPLIKITPFIHNIFILLPFLALSFGIYLEFNLITITYLIISFIYCFSVLCVISNGMPEKESVFLKNGDIIKNGYILEDNPEKNYIIIILPTKKIKVMKDSILKIESSLEVLEKLNIDNETE